MQFKPTIEAGITLAVMQADKARAQELIGLTNTSAVEYTTRVQAADASGAIVDICYSEEERLAFMVTFYGTARVVHEVKTSERTAGGMDIAILNTHQHAGILQLLLDGQLQIDDFDTLEDLIYAHGMLDHDANPEEWFLVGSKLDDAIGDAYNSGAIGSYQFTALQATLRKVADAVNANKTAIANH